MKKIITVALIMVVASIASAALRVSERVSDIDGDTTIQVTDYARIASIVGDVQVSGETNIYTVSCQSVFTTNSVAVTNNYAYIAASTNVQGSETVTFYNSDQDSATDDTAWMKPNDLLTFSGTTSTYYTVVFEKN